MNIAFIPYYKELEEDSLFEHEKYDPTIRYGVDRRGFSKLKELYEGTNHEVHTIDEFEDYNNINLCVFIDMNYDIFQKLRAVENTPKMVYMMREPPTYISFNSHANTKMYSRFFDLILTWDKELAKHTGFKHYNLPYLQPSKFNNKSNIWNNNKLLVLISSDKESTHPEELYSARKSIVEYYGKNHPEDFTLYGRSWDQTTILQRLRGERANYLQRVYEGEIKNKLEAYSTHKFAICFENITNLSGYITEKLFDCLRSGIVPIYWGPNDIEDYIPEECFIDYRNFRTPDELHSYITEMNQEEYEEYIQSATDFLRNNNSEFRAEYFARNLKESIEEVNIRNATDATLIDQPQWMRNEIKSKAIADNIRYHEQSTLEYLRKLVQIAKIRPKEFYQQPELLGGFIAKLRS